MPGLRKAVRGCSDAMTGIVHVVPKKSSRGLGAILLLLYQCPPRSHFGVISLKLLLFPTLRHLLPLCVVRDVCWELLHPISAKHVSGTLKKIKDGAPGPDGRKLSDVKTIPAEELAGDFNLWLLAGYMPV